MESLVIAIIFLLPGISLIFWINKRKFNRRNQSGLEGFSSYEKSLFVRLLERLGKWIAFAMLIFGGFALLMYILEKRQEAKTKEKTVKIEKGRMKVYS